MKDSKKEKIIRNAVKCLICYDIIESTHRHDYVTCQCGNISVDGGHDYLKRVGYMENCEEMSVIEEE